MFDCRTLQGDVDRVAVTVVAVRSKRRSPYKHWIPVVFLAILFSCLLLAHAIVMTDGYYKTCEQLKKRLIQEHHSVGGEAEVMFSIIPSGATFYAIFRATFVSFSDFFNPFISPPLIFTDDIQ